MTFPWMRILLMLVIVGLSSFFLINSRVLILPSMHSSATLLSSTPPPVCSAFLDCEPKNFNQSTDNIQKSSATLININTTLLGYVGNNSLNPDITPVTGPNDIHYVPTYSARYINLAQHQPDDVNPTYLLAYEFVSPPIPSLEIGFEVNFSPQLDWVLSAASGPSRISAWKESNLLFVNAHTC